MSELRMGEQVTITGTLTGATRLVGSQRTGGRGAWLFEVEVKDEAEPEKKSITDQQRLAELHQQALDTTCPTCGAEPTKPCFSSVINTVMEPGRAHLARVTKADNEARKKK